MDDNLLDEIDPQELLAEIDRCEYEQSFYNFFRGGWRYFDPAPFTEGLPLQCIAEHLEAVCYGDIKRLLINIPPRMSKSSMCSVAFPAWIWAQRNQTSTCGPGTHIVSASYSQTLTLRDSVKCRRLIESPWYKGLWGDRFSLTSDQNTKTRFDNSARGSRFCTSVGSTLTGEGGNIIIIDDPNAAQEAFSEATIETTIEWWDSALSTRLNDPRNGAFVVIQQRLAENDLTGHILSKEAGLWQHVMLPMYYEPERKFYTSIGWEDWRTEEDELLWPERFGKQEADALATSLGPYGAAGQLQQRPSVKGGGVIMREWWQEWKHESYPPFDYIIASLDTAYTEKTENDPSAMTIWGVFSDVPAEMANRFVTPQGTSVDHRTLAGRFDEAAAVKWRSSKIDSAPKVMLMYAWNERLPFHELVNKSIETCRRYRVDSLLIESKAAGISVGQEIQRLCYNDDFGVQLINPGAQDKLARLYSIQHLFADLIVYAPFIDNENGYGFFRKWAEMVIAQCEIFPKGKHDDLVDTISQALRHMRSIGVLQRNDEVRDAIEQQMMHHGQGPAPLYPV